MAATLLPPPPDLLRSAAQAAPPELTGALVPSDVPLALLPVRLETRFFAQEDGTQQLRIRVFPDQIHVDSHEGELSTDELVWGRHFWTATWRAAHDEQLRHLAWQQLADRFDPQRAAWIARVLRPLNLDRRPATPLDDAAPLDPAPQFPDGVTEQAPGGAWQRAPLARLMPARFIAVARANGVLAGFALGRPIAALPAVGPDPKAPAAPADDAGAVDPGMRWMVDFDEAERNGMGLRMTLPAATAHAGLDALVVFGVVDALDPEASAAGLAALVDAHHYTGGAAFVRPGTPTNNAADEPSGLDGADPLRARSFAAEWQQLDAPLPSQSNAVLLAQALGFAGDAATATLGSLPGAGATDALDEQQMATALWTPTWGYYLANLIGLGSGTGLTVERIDTVREHFIAHVRAAGPLGCVRLGRQPYGVLPVTMLGDWVAPAGEEAAHAQDLWLKDLLLRVRDQLWRPRLPDVPRVGRSSDATRDLAAVLKSDAISTTYRTRHLLGPQFLSHLHAFLGEDLTARGWTAARDTLTGAVLGGIGQSWRSRLAGGAYDERDRRLTAPLVQPDSDDAALAPDYIAALLAAPPVPLTAADPLPAPPQPATLLHLLLRQALQLEYTWAAARLAAAEPGGPALATLLHDAELVNLGASTATTWRNVLALPSPAAPGETLAQFLTSLPSFEGSPPLAALGRFRAALGHLATLDAASLARLLAGTLDLASYRLDAWITSFASKRLAAQRAAAPTGLRVGAYGWVEHLSPAPPQAPLPTPAGEAGPVFGVPNDAGFIHAPSLAQAQTAALLRNAHLAHAGGDAPDVFAVDCSSRRVRIANELLDGVRQGQPLGALLGYRFERALHERRMSDAIDDFRALAPLVAANAPPTEQSSDAVAARNVVDGLRLHELHEAQRDAPSPLFARCAAVLDELGEAVDALGDALVAESVHQAVRGNTARVASTLQAIAAGTEPPPELEFPRTPRSGIAVTHRVLVLLPDAGRSTRRWPPVSRSPRAQAEPRLDAWAERLLTPANAVRLTVQRVATSGVTATHTFTGRDLDLRPLDLLALAAAQAGGPTPRLDAVVLATARAKFGVEANGETLRIDAGRGADWPRKQLSLDEWRTLASLARAVVTNARALDARDVQPLGAPGESGVDAEEIEARAARAGKALGAAAKKLARLAARATPDAGALAKTLTALMRFGIDSAFPVAPGADAGPLVAQAALAAGEAETRVAAFKALAAPPEADPTRRASAAAQQLAAVFGAGFVALSRFTSPGGAELQHSLDATAALQGGDASAVQPWIARMSRVRGGVARLSASLHAADVTAAGEDAQLAVAQLPHADGDRWVALPETSGEPLAAGKVALVIKNAGVADATRPMAGLMIDEWVELVPSRSEATGIAFQHDAPDARAPQAVLLAVPPVMGRAWTAWDLHRLLLETLDAARLRAIDAEALDNAVLNPVAGAQAVGEVAHFLPALFFAVNVDGDAISPDFGSP